MFLPVIELFWPEGCPGHVAVALTTLDEACILVVGGGRFSFVGVNVGKSFASATRSAKAFHAFGE